MLLYIIKVFMWIWASMGKIPDKTQTTGSGVLTGILMVCFKVIFIYLSSWANGPPLGSSTSRPYVRTSCKYVRRICILVLIPSQFSPCTPDNIKLYKVRLDFVIFSETISLILSSWEFARTIAKCAVLSTTGSSSDHISSILGSIIGLDSYSRQVFNYLDPILIYISLWIDCLFEIRKIAVCFLWLSLPGHYRVTDEALLAETT